MEPPYIVMTRYSKKAHNFYPYGLNYKDLPDDVIDVPESEFKRAIARKPGETFEVVNGLVVITPAPIPTFEQKAAVKLDQIRTKSHWVRHGGIKTVIDGKEVWIFSDEAARLQLMMFLNSGIATEYPIDLGDNKTLLLTTDIANTLLAKIYEHDQTVLLIASEHRKKLMQQEDPSQYNYSTGWPRTYLEYRNGTNA